MSLISETLADLRPLPGAVQQQDEIAIWRSGLAYKIARSRLLTTGPDVFTPQRYGAIGNGIADDTLPVLACFAAAETYSNTYGSATVLGIGKYKITEQILVDGLTGGQFNVFDLNLVLAGAWAQPYQNPLYIKGAALPDSNPATGITITANALKGTLALTLTSASTLAAGDWVVVRTAPAGASASNYASQVAQISRIVSNTIYLEQPLAFDVLTTNSMLNVNKLAGLVPGVVVDGLTVDGSGATGTPYSPRFDMLLRPVLWNISATNMYGGACGGNYTFGADCQYWRGLDACGGGGSTGDATSATFYCVAFTNPLFRNLVCEYTLVNDTPSVTGVGWVNTGCVGGRGGDIWISGASTRAMQQWFYYDCSFFNYHCNNNRTTGWDIDKFSKDCVFGGIEALGNGDEGVWAALPECNNITVFGIKAYGNGRITAGKYDIGWSGQDCALYGVSCGTYDINDTTIVFFDVPPTAYPNTLPQRAPKAVWSNSGALTIGAVGAAVEYLGSQLFFDIAAQQDDWHPSGVESCNVLTLNPTGSAQHITGLIAGAVDNSAEDGRLILIQNRSANSLFLDFGSGSSASGNRFFLSTTDYEILSGYSVRVRYDINIPGWRMG